MGGVLTEWAVVVGDGLNALGVIRSLAARNVRVALLARTRDSEPALSRCAAVKVFYRAQSDLPAELLQLAERLGGRPVLFLTEEEAVWMVSNERGALLPRYRFRMAPHEMMIQLTHKDGVQRAAEQAGLAIPKALRLQSEDDLARVTELRYPCVLKPGYKHNGYGERFKKAYSVASPDEAVALFHEILPTLPDLVLQEWIEGQDDAIYFCLQYSASDRAVVSFTGRKLRAWPPQVGGTASCMPAYDVHDQLSAMTEAFFASVGYEGMGSMEYKLDARDNRFYVVEPTVGRTDFQEEVATVNGCNVPFAAYCYECELDPPRATRSTTERIWKDETTNRWSSQQQGVHPAFARLPAVDAHFRWSDPAPWVALQLGRVRQRLDRVRPRLAP